MPFFKNLAASTTAVVTLLLGVPTSAQAANYQGDCWYLVKNTNLLRHVNCDVYMYKTAAGIKVYRWNVSDTKWLDFTFYGEAEDPDSYVIVKAHDAASPKKFSFYEDNDGDWRIIDANGDSMWAITPISNATYGPDPNVPVDPKPFRTKPKNTDQSLEELFQK